jgi:GH25 family lysozyme M1 (1,4-beta-N-acetylmuramidase)
MIKRMVVKKLISKLLALSLQQKVIAGLVVAVIAASGITAGIVLHNRQASTTKQMSAKAETAEKKEKTEEKAEELKPVEVQAVQVTVPSFQEVTVATSSIQKDLNVYFNNSSGKKISGVNFKVKLIDPKKYKSIQAYNDAISLDNAKIAKANSLNLSGQLYSDALQQQINNAVKDSSGDDAATKDLSSGNHVNAATGNPLTLGDALQIEKNNDIAAYNQALSKVKGDTYEDKDKDGLIYLNSINAGDYKACFVPVDGYSAQQYSSDANVKEEIVYQPVANVEQKVEVNVPDPQPKVETPVEAEIKDSVSHVDSSKKENVSYHTMEKSQTLKAEVNETAIVLYAAPDKNASEVSVSKEGSKVVEAVSENTQAVTASVSSDGSSVLLSAVSGLINDCDTNVKVAYQPSDGTDPQVITYKVKIYGNGDPLYTEDKKTPVYTDASGSKQATIGDYNSEKSYNTKTVDTTYYGWQTIDGNRYYFDQNGNKVTGSQVIGGIKYNFGSDGVLLTGGIGIDVSKWQGNIDWSQAKTAISYAIIRCGYRGSKTGALAKDPYYEKNMKGAKANGVKVGIYFYSNAGSEAEAVEEASLAVQLAKEQGGVSLPIYIDIEGSMSNNSPDLNTAIANAFVKTVNAAGYRGGVYSGYNFFNMHMNLNGILSNASIWCARYNTYCGLKRHYDIWQYSSKGSVPGISGNVDMNTSYF